ncbi:unnamed protein product [Dicrocoelium dendriticum]|nr:unnamed protein product [Dicrocoelium dendriticum]
MQDRPGISAMLNAEASVDEVARLSLLTWCREATSGYPGVFIRDFTDSWRDGRAILALIHRYRPDLIDFQLINRQNAKENLDLAFTVAEKYLQVTRLFDAEDLATAVDERSIITYVASLYEALTADIQTVPPMPPLYIIASNDGASHSTRAILPSESSKLLNSRWAEYKSIATELAQWLQLTTSQMATRNFPSDLEGIQSKVLEALKRHRLEERPRRERERQQLVRLNEELKHKQVPNDPFLSIDYIDRLWTEYDRAIRERELTARAEANRLSRLQWTGDRVARDCRSVEAQLTALERHMQLCLG